MVSNNALFRRALKRRKPIRPKKVGELSRSEFKRRLKIVGHKFTRDFWFTQKSTCCGRLYRWRWNDGAVDISCPVEEFDRWANSTESTMPITEWMETNNVQETQKAIAD